MPILKQQNSILSEQELQLLASDDDSNIEFKVYSYQCKVTLPECKLYLSNNIEQLILMLHASARGIAVVLPDHIESEASFTKLVTLLTLRADICVFWLGQLPSMEANLPVFVHCLNTQRLQYNVASWKNYINRTFSGWISAYPVAFITEDKQRREQHAQDLATIGLANIHYFTAQDALTQLNNQKLLIIDIDIKQLHLTELLNILTKHEKFPIVMIYGQVASNVCRSTQTLIENQGFPILASLNTLPDKAQWHKLFSSLFSKVYLKHWVSKEKTETGAYRLFCLETQLAHSYFCVYGMSKKQIAALPKNNNIRHIIAARSLQDWFPEGIKRETHAQLATDLNCDLDYVDICIEAPENILTTSLFFSALVTARLAKKKIYWVIKSEKALFQDILKNFPISDVILSDTLSLQLLGDPSKALLEFIEQAQTQEVNIIASLQQNSSANEALSLYGIHAVLDNHSYINGSYHNE